jgi:hypothetical protein
MDKKSFLSYWYAGMAAAATVIGAVAVLLLALIATARSILSNADRALKAANEIVTNTRPIWQLEQTNEVASQLLEDAQAIEQHATQIADTLEGVPTGSERAS